MTSMRSKLHDIRRTQLGAAIGATEIVGASLEPFQASFIDSLTEVCNLSSDGGLQRLGVETVIPANQSASWFDLLRDVYGMNTPNAFLAESFTLGAQHLSIGVEEGRESSVPALWFGVTGQWTRAQIVQRLAQYGVQQDVCYRWDELMGRLRVDQVRGMTLRFESPIGEATFELNMVHRFTREEQADTKGRLDYAMEMLGIASDQRAWLRATVDAFGAAPHNGCEIVTRTTRTDLAPRMTLKWPNAPLSKCLEVFGQFNNSPQLGARFGALSALGDEAPQADRLCLEGNTEPSPRTGIEFFLPRIDLGSYLG